MIWPYGKARNHKTIPHIIGINSSDEAGQKPLIETKPKNHVTFCELVKLVTSLYWFICREFGIF